jgi:hypothetical protein
MATPLHGTATFTPNEIFRRVRKIYLVCVVIAIPLLFVAFCLAALNIGGGLPAAVLAVAGVGLIIYAMLTRGVAICPRCGSQLMWKKGPLGTGRISITEKSHCPGCGLDLNAPWVPEPDDAPDGAPAGPTEAPESTDRTMP